MKKYEVSMTIEMGEVREVWADNEEDAIDKARVECIEEYNPWWGFDQTVHQVKEVK